jgi:integrase
MKRKLTKRTIDAAPRGTFVWDSEVPGFGLKVTPAGKKVYILQYRMGGRGTMTRRFTIGVHGSDGMTADKARGEAIKLRGQIRGSGGTRVDPQAVKRTAERGGAEAPRFAEVAEAYLDQADKKLRPSSAREWRRIIERDVLPAWGKKPIKDIARADVRALVEAIAERGAAIQANRTLSRLKTLFNWAVQRELIAVSPAVTIKLDIQEIDRDRVLSHDELRWFWAACDRLGWPFGPLFKLLLLTAQRRDEVGSIEWAHLELGLTTWTIPREKAKNDRAHEVHLAPQAMALLHSLPRTSETFVFTTTGVTPVSGFSKAKKVLDRLMEAERRRALDLPENAPPAIPTWILHDLRRTAATGMARMNIPPHIVDKILNHVSGAIRGVAAVYNRHAYLDERRTALDAWATRIETLLAGNPANVVPLRRPG